MHAFGYIYTSTSRTLESSILNQEKNPMQTNIKKNPDTLNCIDIKIAPKEKTYITITLTLKLKDCVKRMN